MPNITAPTILPNRVAHVDSNSATDQNTQSAAENQNYQNMRAVIGASDTYNDTINSIEARVSSLEGGSIVYIDDTDSPYTIADGTTTLVLMCDTSGGNINITMPTLADNQSRKIEIYHYIGGNNINVDGEGAETIESMTDIDLPKQGDRLKTIGTASEWKITEERISCQLRLDTYAGYGSADTMIMRFTNSRENYGNLFSENHSTGYNGNTEGLEITINKTGKYSFSFTATTPAAGTITGGFSINSTQLNIVVYNINVQNKLSVDSAAPQYIMSASWSGYLTVGDIIRVHTDGQVPFQPSWCTVSAAYIGN